MESKKESLIKLLKNWFGINLHDGTYFYNLTRDKQGFDYETITADDFEEVESEQVYELADEILKWIEEYQQ